MVQHIPFHVLPWFFTFMLLNIVMLGAVFTALGSACNDAKQAQSMTMPAMFPVMIPMFLLVPILREPLSTFATGLSLFPLFTPTLMVMRMSTPGGIPAWQPWVGLALVAVCAVVAVWAGGRVFRVGLQRGLPVGLALALAKLVAIPLSPNRADLAGFKVYRR